MYFMFTTNRKLEPRWLVMKAEKSKAETPVLVTAFSLCSMTESRREQERTFICVYLCICERGDGAGKPFYQ